MLVTFELPSAQDTRFAPSAFADLVGRYIPVRTVHNETIGRVLTALVAPLGNSVFLTVDIRDELLAKEALNLNMVLDLQPRPEH